MAATTMARAGGMPAIRAVQAGAEGALRLAAAVAIDKPQQPGKRIGRGRGVRLGFDADLGVARERWQRQRKFLRNRLAYIDRVAAERFERDLLADLTGSGLLGLRRAVEQFEPLGKDTCDRIERNDAALLEGRFEIGAQQNGPFTPWDHPRDQFDRGLEPIQRHQIETPGQRRAFVFARADSLAVRLGADSGQPHAPRELGGAAHRSTAPSAGTSGSARAGGSPNAMSPASSALASCRASAAACPRTYSAIAASCAGSGVVVPNRLRDSAACNTASSAASPASYAAKRPWK